MSWRKLDLRPPGEQHEAAQAASKLADKAVDKAHAALADLGRQRVAAAEQQQELTEKRRKLALAALTGTSAQRAKLDAVTSKAAEIALRIEDIGFATDAAGAAIAEAEAEAARTAHRVTALQAKRKLSDLAAAGTAASTALNTFMDKLRQYYEIAEEIRRLSGVGPVPAVVRVNLQGSIDAKLFELRMNVSPLQKPAHLYPTIGDLTGRWVAEMSVSLGRMTGDAPPPVEVVEVVEDDLPLGEEEAA